MELASVYNHLENRTFVALNFIVFILFHFGGIHATEPNCGHTLWQHAILPQLVFASMPVF